MDVKISENGNFKRPLHRGVFRDSASLGPFINPRVTASHIPAWLAAGLMLEDRQILLPWGARQPDVLTSCHPDQVIDQTGWCELYWKSPTALRGLRASTLEVVLYPHGWIDSACLWINQAACPTGCRGAFEHTCTHLTHLFGPPTNTALPCTCLPEERTAQWQRGALHLTVALRQMAVMEPFHYWCLVHIAIH